MENEYRLDKGSRIHQKLLTAGSQSSRQLSHPQQNNGSCTASPVALLSSKLCCSAISRRTMPPTEPPSTASPSYPTYSWCYFRLCVAHSVGAQEPRARTSGSCGELLLHLAMAQLALSKVMWCKASRVSSPLSWRQPHRRAGILGPTQ